MNATQLAIIEQAAIIVELRAEVLHLTQLLTEKANVTVPDVDT